MPVILAMFINWTMCARVMDSVEEWAPFPFLLDESRYLLNMLHKIFAIFYEVPKLK